MNFSKALTNVLLAIVLSLCLTIPAVAGDPTIEELKGEIKKLRKEIEGLEKRQSATETKTAETEKKVAEEAKKKVEVGVGWKKGFYLKTPDDNYMLKIRLVLQQHFTYLHYDDFVNGNPEDQSNFYIRRGRVLFMGNAPNKDWGYFFHVQLEPTGAVNLHDANFTWKRYPYFQVQIGRAKIPYTLEFWQSGLLENGVDRSIFTGEPEGNWPGGNASFAVSTEDSVTKFPTGGLTPFRSQGVQLQGDINMAGQKGFLQYWAGVFNGWNKKGTFNADDALLYVARISINPFGEYNLFLSGDVDYSETPKLCLLAATIYNKERLTKIKSATGTETTVSAYDAITTGYTLGEVFRYKGFSFDADYAYERFKQDREGGYTFDRWGYRVNAGYFFIPKKWEVVLRHGYVERIDDNTNEKSLASGLGLVSVGGVSNNAIEDNLQEYSAGLNYYIDEHWLKISADYSYLVREFSAVPGQTLGDDKQADNRFRIMAQWFF
ncbi:MAG: porin [Nitrospirota bacterium]